MDTFKGSHYAVHFSRDGVSGDLFDTAKLRGDVLFRFSQDGVPGDWLQYEAFLLVEGLKGPLSTQFTLLQLQTGDASFFPPLLKT